MQAFQEPEQALLATGLYGQDARPDSSSGVDAEVRTLIESAADCAEHLIESKPEPEAST